MELNQVSAQVVDEAPRLSYLKLSTKKIGLLINFNVAHLKTGIKRMVNKL